MTKKGIALLVGLKEVDPKAPDYNGWDGKRGCWGCELDVDNMEMILAPLGYEITKLKTGEATKDNILASLRRTANTVQPGDTFVFYFSGHGGQQPDENSDESDGKDETLCAFDGEIKDDYLDEVWRSFQEGCRIVMVSDSCNSGTNYKNRGVEVGYFTPIMPVDEELANEMQAQLIHYGGCRDGFTSAGYFGGGAFTKALCRVWANGDFKGTYKSFYEEIKARLGEQQVPAYNLYGTGELSFEQERPFGIEFPVGGHTRCVFEIPGATIEEARKVVEEKGPAVILNALDKILEQRPQSFRGSCTVASDERLPGSDCVYCQARSGS
jgi:N-acetylmuramoyl-L-alanine amidase